MSSNFPDLYAICNHHLQDPTYRHESEVEFVLWVYVEFMIQIPKSHTVPSGHRDDFQAEIELQIRQWLQTKLYGSSLQAYREKL